MTAPEPAPRRRSRWPRPTWAGWTALVAVFLMIALGGTSYLTGSEGSSPPGAAGDDAADDGEVVAELDDPSDADPFTHPGAFVGDQVGVSGTISEVPDARMFRIENDTGESLLVVYGGLPYVKKNLLVYINGVILEREGPAVEEQLSADPPIALSEYSDEYVLVPTSKVQKLGLASQKLPSEKARAAASASDPAPSGGTTVSSAPAQVAAAPPSDGSSSGESSSGGGASGGGGSSGAASADGRGSTGGGGGSTGGGGGSTGGGSSSRDDSTTRSRDDRAKISYTGTQSSGQYSDDATFEAKLTYRGDPVARARVVFELKSDGRAATFDAETDRKGIASTTEELTLAPGEYRLIARYERRGKAAVTDKTSFEINRENAALDLTAEGNGDQGNDEKAERLIATLNDADDGGAIADRTITFYADDGVIGSARTDSDGRATIEVPARYRNGNTTFTARFGGDDYYLSSTDTA